MPNLQIRGVPDDVHARLKHEAAAAGQSLNEFMLERIGEFALLPTLPELAARIRERTSYDGPSSASIIREDRDPRARAALGADRVRRVA